MNPDPERPLVELLQQILQRCGGAIEFWTVVCLSQRMLGPPEEFVTHQWNQLAEDIHQLRQLTGCSGLVPPMAQEQVVKLSKTASDLREVFDVLIRFEDEPLPELEQAVLRLGATWQELQLRVALLGAMLTPHSAIPRLTSEQEAYYQTILDSLFDQIATARGQRFGGSGD